MYCYLNRETKARHFNILVLTNVNMFLKVRNRAYDSLEDEINQYRDAGRQPFDSLNPEIIVMVSASIIYSNKSDELKRVLLHVPQSCHL